MKTATSVAQMLVRATGVINFVLGLLFWTHNALSMIPLHMQVGFVFVLSLWALAVLAARVGVSPGVVGLGIAWGLLVPILGMTQDRLLVGNAHWVIQVLHLLVALAAMRQAEGLAVRIRQTQTLAFQP